MLDETVQQHDMLNYLTQVLIDHDTPAGFESIIGARDKLLRLGRKDTEDSLSSDREGMGCHVVAPVRYQVTEYFQIY